MKSGKMIIISNIPRYVDSSEAAESWDIYASMFGGIPNLELDKLKEYWKAFPELRNALLKIPLLLIVI